jgi:hypothetical protein
MDAWIRGFGPIEARGREERFREAYWVAGPVESGRLIPEKKNLCCVQFCCPMKYFFEL